jgi:hypothetical protein
MLNTGPSEVRNRGIDDVELVRADSLHGLLGSREMDDFFLRNPWSEGELLLSYERADEEEPEAVWDLECVESTVLVELPEWDLCSEYRAMGTAEGDCWDEDCGSRLGSRVLEVPSGMVLGVSDVFLLGFKVRGLGTLLDVLMSWGFLGR